MCYKKTTIFACRCFLRDTSACPHSVCLAEGEFERSRMEQLAAEVFARPLILPSTSSSALPPGMAPPPGFAPPPPFSPNSASSASSSPGPGNTTTSTNTNTGNTINASAPEFAAEHEHERSPSPTAPAQESEPPRIIDGLFYERRMGQVQRAVHWDVWRTEWFPCAAYHSTHLDTIINSDEEYMNCPEYFGNEDKEVKMLGLCEQCRDVHADALRGMHQNQNGFDSNLEGGDRGDGQGQGQGRGQVQNHGQERQVEAEDEMEQGMRDMMETLNRWMDMDME
ncbi:hypothetical protein GE21DRAFT_8 [Neurospora crassa]|uniref:Uncharacterized protein n=1 Tax=Neurospora crassa (strain ATCC 24698 / 74-OR23-1A / CBS 708.71 / DSM 1257 / FGSC 987) TaxID=367110 RepID=Q7S148_NEUCR|nr:hypothetical protein NCU09908 [Neurospora crassa OR74A]EAA29071.1 hypothetical protein NCU09908 [Neurospora crassa OR74A]KHE79295.1 hypothetical protein GE21DRAFT_8 [Neurospora crassa]|eukprot:XP_958307.1 hypothetical protein NCU09908 [Neurospora crassa OR74A]